jgi:hypothetical protein
MKRRSYVHCPQCHTRMRMFCEDTDKGRRFYYCICGQRSIYLKDINAASDDWPRAIFDDAIRQGVMDRAGRVL